MGAYPRACHAQRAMFALPDLLRVLRHRDFRLMWLGQGASVIGDGIVIVALALFVVDLTGSATDLGLVLAAYSLPLVGFVLIGGVLADRLPRHRVVVATDLARFALHGLLAILILTGVVAIWQLVAIGLLFGTAEAFFRPAASGLLPQTVPEEDIQEANAVMSATNNLAEFAGPALATALVLGISPAAAFGLDALTFLVSAALLVRVRPRRRAVAPSDETASGMLADLRSGYAEVRSRAWIWATLAAFCVALFFVLAPWFVLGPIVAREQYGEIAVFGALSAVFGGIDRRPALAPAPSDAQRLLVRAAVPGRDRPVRRRAAARARGPDDVLRRRRRRAVRDLVADGARRARPGRQALARDVV